VAEDDTFACGMPYGLEACQAWAVEHTLGGAAG